jgi:hypothetical protein
MALSPLEESLLFYGMGYFDPLIALKTLLRLLTAANLPVDWIVFHGNSTLIPSTATAYAQQRRSIGANVLVCDELNGVEPMTNSVVLGRSTTTRSNTAELDVDE